MSKKLNSTNSNSIKNSTSTKSKSKSKSIKNSTSTKSKSKSKSIKNSTSTKSNSNSIKNSTSTKSNSNSNSIKNSTSIKSKSKSIKNSTSIKSKSKSTKNSTSTKSTTSKRKNQEWIELKGVRQNNLKGISVRIPKYQLTVVTGLSGSGKSSLVFDSLFMESQRRFLNSLSNYSKNFLSSLKKPEIDSLSGLSPSIAIDQRTASTNPRSTVGTMTESLDFLRLLYARVGRPVCPIHNEEVSHFSKDEILAWAGENLKFKKVRVLAPVVRDQKGEFKKELLQWEALGFVKILYNNELIFIHEMPKLNKRKSHIIDLVVDQFKYDDSMFERLKKSLKRSFAVEENYIAFEIDGEKKVFSLQSSCAQCGYSFPELEPRHFSFNNRQGGCESCSGLGRKDLQEYEQENRIGSGGMYMNISTLQYKSISKSYRVCSECSGTRLNKRARSVFIDGLSIDNLCGVSIEDLLDRLKGLGLKKKLGLKGLGLKKLELSRPEVSEPIVKELVHRLEYLNEVGLSYLSLDRGSETLSGGERQRLRLASQLANPMIGVLYVLDEPSIGLHPHDHGKLLKVIDKVKDQGNTVVVVEHDEETMKRADYIIEIGPGAGRMGGEVVAQEPYEDFIKRKPLTLTGSYLTHDTIIKRTSKRKDKKTPALKAALKTTSKTTLETTSKTALKTASKTALKDKQTFGVGDKQTFGVGDKQTFGVGDKQTFGVGDKQTFGVGDKQTFGVTDKQTFGVGDKQTFGVGDKQTFGVGDKQTFGLTDKQTFGVGDKQTFGVGDKQTFGLTGASLHNLKNIEVDLPFNALIGVSGVSGSGKSSLIMNTIAQAKNGVKGVGGVESANGVKGVGGVESANGVKGVGGVESANGVKGVDGVEFRNFDKFKVINTIDQKPIGKTPRSIPATYVGAFNLIRALFVKLPESQVRGFQLGHFSFNSNLGRCSSCQGMGVKKINSGFLSNVSIDCLDCGGTRFKPEILSVRFKEKNLSEVLNFSINEAHEFFENQPSIKRKLKTLLDVGLGYLKIGQDSTTLSGGEAQRVKLGKELSKSYKGRVLYILDEPTTGLHFEDIERLLNLLSQLVEKGHTVIVIEHQLDLLAECDHLLDLGPFGGKHGGEIVDQGPPKNVAKRSKGVTGKCLKKHLLF